MNGQPSPANAIAQGNAHNAAMPGLDNLRDIHLPAPVSWWPPAPGWWLLAAIIIVVTLAFAIWLLRRAHQRRYRKVALQQLQALYAEWQRQRDDAVFARATNRLLKQTALAAFPAAKIAALNGGDWLDFLDRQIKKPRFTEPDVRALASVYLRNPEPIAAPTLRDAAHYWIRSHRC